MKLSKSIILVFIIAIGLFSINIYSNSNSFEFVPINSDEVIDLLNDDKGNSLVLFSRAPYLIRLKVKS